MIITELSRQVSRADLIGKERDVVRLTWEERRRGRQKLTTESGREVALALPTGSVLVPGAILAIESEWYLEVEALPEPVIALFPRDHTEALRVAFEVGNRHFPLALEDDKTLLVPDDPAMAQLLDRINVPWERRNAVFFPIGNASPH